MKDSTGVCSAPSRIAINSREIELRERFPVRHDNFFKIYLKFALLLRRLFLSVVPMTRAVYFHVNVTCFAPKHLKFDSHYSN